LIGKTLAHYEITALLGKGAMGEVYRARDTKLGREIALKILPPDCANDPGRRSRFEREAKAVAALQHPAIVTIYSIEEIDAIHFLTMELVEGQTITELLSAEAPSLGRFFEIAIPLADGVSCAHAAGIAHRDLKPDNVMLDGQRRLKILDFGLAKLCFPQSSIDETVPAQAHTTQAGSIMGTVAYMSPEQITGSKISPRSDIFSLGIIFHELLSRVRPFPGESLPAIMHAIVNEEAPRLASLPDAVAGVINRCLKKNPTDRYADAGELRDALQALEPAVASSPKLEPAATTSVARTAANRGDWERTYRDLCATRERRDLSPEELEVLAECAVWLDAFGERIQANEMAYAAYAKSGRNVDAARVALHLVHDYVQKCAGTVAGGWQRRAERLLRNEPDCIEQGLLLRRQTIVALENCDFEGALDLNEKCAAMADRFNDSDLRAEALHDRGQILIARGEVEEGKSLVDEAMTSATSGEVGPSPLGNLFCRTMSVCRSLADFDRVREWSEAAWRWCEPYGESPYHGICRVHRAETMRHQGRWAEARRAAQKACDDFSRDGSNNHAGEALNELGELALCEGDFQGADDAFRRAHELGYDPVPGLPLLRLAQGRGAAAQQTITRALSEDPDDRLHRARLLTAMIRIALANGDIMRAETAVDELAEIGSDFECPTFKAHALMGRGFLELERGKYELAAPLLREAWSIFNEMGFTYDSARAGVLLATVYLRLGNQDDAELHLGAACKVFRELGAQPDLDSASALINGAD